MGEHSNDQLKHGPTLEQKSLCGKKCKEIFIKYDNIKEMLDCLEECKSSSPLSPNLQKLLFNDLSEKLEANTNEAQDLLSMTLSYNTDQDSLF